MEMIEKDIVIIGAGLTGLTLAHNLKKQNRDFIVLEKQDRVGGVIDTFSSDGFVYECGPNTGVLSNDYVTQLFDELGDKCQLQVASNAVNKRYIFKDGHWVAMPMGLFGGIATPLFTFRDKLRLLGEPWRKAGINPHETLDQLVIRRMGQSFLDYAVDPFIGGVYAGDPTYIVPKYALPKLYNLEQKYGSFIGGTIKLHKEKKASGVKMNHKEGHPKSKTFSAKGGLKNLVQALYQSAGADRFLLSVDQITIKEHQPQFIIQVTCKNGQHLTIKAQKVVITVSANQLPNMLQLPDCPDMKAIGNLKYAQMIEIALGFKTWDGMKLDGFGGLIPYKEKQHMLGVLFPSAFFPDRAPQGGALLTVFVGGVRHADLFELNDEAIMQLVEQEFTPVMKLKSFHPDLVVISRHQRAIAQYGADCEARFVLIDQLQKKYPGLQIAGSMRDGIGMADRIKQGFLLAEQL